MLPSPSPRTIFLTERVPHCCRLTSADVDFLLAQHRRHVELVPTGERRRYRLVARGQVGTLVAPTCRLVIRPKVPLVNLLALLDPGLRLSLQDDAVAPAAEPDLLDFLAGRLAQAMRERAAAGLQRGYRERAEQGPFLQGRLDIPAQLRQGPGRKEHLHSRFEDFTADVPCNQAPRWTAARLLGLPFLTAPTRLALEQAVEGFAGVGAVAPSWNTLEPAALPAEYGPLLHLCRLLADALPPSEEAGTAPAAAFLLDLERLFEGYLTRQVTAAFGGRKSWAVAVQPGCVVSPPCPGPPELLLRPDLVLERGGRRCCVIDAKWKRLPRRAVLTDDLYQLLAYCTALGVGRGALVYPGSRDHGWEYELAGSAVCILIATLRVVGSRERCEKSGRRLMGRLAQLARR
jgi:5-methylcytosine-specific restriction enzyme subunit McrC